MWCGLRKSPEADSEFVRSAIELLQSTSRHLIITTGGVYLAWHLVATVTWPNTIGWTVWLITPVVVLTVALSLWLLPRQLLAAQVVWQMGLAAAITLAVTMFREPQIAFFYALLPLMAVVTVGWPAGVLVEALVIGLTWWLSRNPGVPPVPAAYSMAIVAGGALTGLLGWAAARALLTAIQWHVFSFAQAQENMEEARQHRAHLARVLKDLDQACYRLERTNHMLVLARAEAEEAREARNRFALAVSHELRTPLNFIIGFSELMVNTPDTYAEPDRWPPGLYEDIREIYRSSTHLLRLVNDVLDLGQIEALRMALVKEWVDPARIVREVAAMVRPAFARKGLWFRTEVGPDLPDAFVDRTRIRQVLLNLVSNSLRVTEHGGVTVRLQRDAESLHFCVQDTGPGIAEGDIPKMFEEFRQVQGGSWRRREGAGLGIPISRRFVELHGGRMWVESQVGEGTSLYFTLPLPGTARDLASPLDERASDARYWRRVTQRAERERMLLVVSPDPAAAEVIGRYVGDYGLAAVHSLDEVASRVAELLPSALIIDRASIQAEEARSLLRELPYDVPVIRFTFPGGAGRSRRPPAGVSSYLVKPIARQDLAEAVWALGPGVGRLLVVDDDPAMVRFVTLALKSAEGDACSPDGYELMTAFTGAEALERLRRDRPDAVLLDLALPDISGWTVLEELRRDPDLHDVPVILITAYDWPQTSAGGDGEALQVFMRRPLSRDELTSALKCLLGAIQAAYPAVSAGPARPAGLAG
jgi:signal transduction histidine kinase/CheY-like chemotaxis protein